jgi:hypothetical protein
MPTSTRGGGGALHHPKVQAAVAHGVSAGDPRAGKLLERAQGHPLTPQQQTALGEAQGKMTPLEAHAHLVKAGVLPKLQVVHDEANPFNRFVTNIMDAAISSPAGLAYTGKQIGSDTKKAAHGDFSFKGTRKVGSEIGKSVKEDFKHPLRNPGFTLLDASAVVGGVEGAASRGAAAAGAGAAAREAGRSSVRAALTRAPSEGGSLLRKPLPGTREYRLNDLAVKVPNSSRPLVRAGQKLHAKVLNDRPESPALHKKIGDELTRGRQVVTAAERAPAGALAHRARKLTAPQQEAIGVVAEGKHLDERIALHKTEAAKAPRGSQRYLDSRNKVAVLEAARRYIVHDAEGKPQLAPAFERTILGRASKVVGRGEATAAELRSAYESAGRGATKREATLQEAGVLDPAQADARLHGPGRVIEGARYRDVTPSRQGRSPALEREMRRRDSVQRRLNEALDKEAEFHAKQRSRDLGALSEPDAKTRLAELDHLYVKLVQKIVPETSNYGGKISQAEQLRRNFENSRAGKGNRIGAKRQRTVSQEEFQTAEDALLKTIEKHRGNASADRAAAIVAERDRLRNALNARGEASMTGGAAPPLPSAPASAHVSVPRGSNPHRNRIVRLGHALEEQQKRVDALAKAVETRKEPTGLVGAEDFKGGEFRMPYASTDRSIKTGTAQFKGGIPAKPGSVTKPFKGELLLSGGYKSDRVTQLAKSMLEADRYSDVLRLRDQLLKASSAEPKDGYAPIREKASAKPLPQAVQRIMEKQDSSLKLSHDERKQLERWAQDWEEQIFPDPAKLTEHDGIRWVPQALLDHANARSVLADAINNSRAVDIVDSVNNATKLAVLYLKPAYAARTPPATRSSRRAAGVRAPLNLARSARLNARLGEDATAVLDSVIGEGLAHALTGGGGLRKGGQQGRRRLVEGRRRPVPARRVHPRSAQARLQERRAVARVADRPGAPRRSRRGRAPRERRADRLRPLGPNERAIVRRVIFFYPWVKGSTMYAGRLVRDNPIVAAGLAHVAREGKSTPTSGRSRRSRGIVQGRRASSSTRPRRRARHTRHRCSRRSGARARPVQVRPLTSRASSPRPRLAGGEASAQLARQQVPGDRWRERHREVDQLVKGDAAVPALEGLTQGDTEPGRDLPRRQRRRRRSSSSGRLVVAAHVQPRRAARAGARRSSAR